MKESFRRLQQAEWGERWATSSKGAASRRLQPRLRKEVPSFHKGLRKPQSALVVQLRTGKVGFDSFLYHHHVPGVDSPNCDCGGGEMTVGHVLLDCSRWDELRAKVLRHVDGNSLETLLGTRKGCLAAARMVQKTGLLAQFSKSDMERQEARELGEGESEEEGRQ